MANPLGIATKGKGFFPMLARGKVIASRYGFTVGKMDDALTKFTNTVQQFGCSATIPITATALEMNPTIAKKYHNQGLELAIHGLQHLDYSLLRFEKQLEHLHRARQIFKNAGVEVTGFRCPYLRWNEDTLTALSASDFTFDSSQALAWDVVPGPETQDYRRVLDFYRAQSAREYPALPHLVDGLVRIPYCLPDDEALVERLHLSNVGSMAEIWLAMLDRTYQAGELFTLGLHPERAPLCQKALQAVLENARSLTPSVWIARLDEISAWFLALGKTTFKIQHDPDDLYSIQIHGPERATLLMRSVRAMTSTQPWAHGYHTTVSKEVTVQSSKRPVVGISPWSPVSLQLFLRHQGYLIEISSDPQAYSCYLDLRAFTFKDERAVINELEGVSTPLVRLSRWPDSARSALSVTGDVDAFTIWDYGRRLWND